jgi:hypothetical protein
MTLRENANCHWTRSLEMISNGYPLDFFKKQSTLYWGNPMRTAYNLKSTQVNVIMIKLNLYRQLIFFHTNHEVSIHWSTDNFITKWGKWPTHQRVDPRLVYEAQLIFKAIKAVRSILVLQFTNNLNPIIIPLTQFPLFGFNLGQYPSQNLKYGLFNREIYKGFCTVVLPCYVMRGIISGVVLGDNIIMEQFIWSCCVSWLT